MDDLSRHESKHDPKFDPKHGARPKPGDVGKHGDILIPGAKPAPEVETK